MKKRVVNEVDVCDFCQTEQVYGKGCNRCDKMICYECMPTHGKEYHPGVHHGGSDGAIYCNACDASCREARTPLHAAYLLIASLRNEYAGWHANFTERANAAELSLKKLLHP